jgi:3',5'-cyclic AMP phosphodiesterase CpdA
MTVLLHVSDTHFGTEVPAVVEALIALAHAQSPDLVVLSGDITQRARRHQFAAARRFVDALAAPAQLAVPGNHDVPLFDLPSRLLAPYRNYRQAFGPQLEPTFEGDDLLVLGLNTTRRWRHKHGEVSQRQVAAVADRLRRARPAQVRVVVVHQPVLVPRDSERNNLLRGGALALRRWAAAGADLVLGGHIHLPYVVQFTPDPPADGRTVWCVQAGTAVSRRVRRGVPNSVNLLRTADGQCDVERWDYAAARQRFECVMRTRVPIER